MKLSNTLKKAFVSAVMHDVPQVDYLEQTQKCGRKHVERLTPPEILDAIKKYPDWFEPNGYYTPGYLPMVYVLNPKGNRGLLEKDEQAWQELTVIAEAYAQQEASREELELKLKGVVNGCNTLKQLKEALPEFEKYMPAESEPPSKNLPALANIVADFQAAGLKFNTEATT